MIALYWLWRFVMFLTGVTPRRLSFAIYKFAGGLFYYIMGLRRDVAHENFAHVLGKPTNDPEVHRVARQSFQNFALLLRDVMLYPSMSMAELNERVSLHHAEYLDQVFALDKGMVVVSVHFGNMDLLSAVLADKFGPITVVAETLQPIQLMNFLTRIRKEHQVLLYPYEIAPRKILQALKRNEMTAFLLDFGVTHHLDITTVPVNFFGEMTDFPAGPAQLALLTGAPIVVGHTEITNDGHIEGYATPPIIVKKTGNRQHDMQVTMQEIATRIEGFIQRAPGQWYVFRPMWNTAQTLKRNIPSLSHQGSSREITQ